MRILVATERLRGVEVELAMTVRAVDEEASWFPRRGQGAGMEDAELKVQLPLQPPLHYRGATSALMRLCERRPSKL